MSNEARSPRSVPQRLNLENQRKRARALLNAARARDPHALRRFAAQHLGLEDSPNRAPVQWSLSAAQLVIAREQGFASWAKLKAQTASACPALKAALVEAADRAQEAEVQQPLFVDSLAHALAGPQGRALHAALRSTTWPPFAAGPRPEFSILTRYFDDALTCAVRSSSIRQVVLLGAGMDTRAFRLAWPSGLAFFEIDQGAVFERKERVLRRLRARAKCDRRVVPADIAAPWQRSLLAAGFAPDRAVAVLIQPRRLVSLERAAVERTFATLRAIAAPGSWLGLHLLGAATMESPFMKPLQQKLAELGYPRWRFGVRDPEAFLAAHGWRGECVVAGAPEANYGRWRYGYLPRTVPDRAVPREYLAQAWRMP